MVELRLERAPTGHLLVAVELDGRGPLPFLLDTAASGSVVSPAVLPPGWRDRVRTVEGEEVHGAGGSLPQETVVCDTLTLGPWTCTEVELTVLDLGHLKDHLDADQQCGGDDQGSPGPSTDSGKPARTL